MASIKDNRGYNQGFKPGKALTIRTLRRCKWIISQMNLEHSGEILEIGCGTGELSMMLAERTDHIILGTDICVPFINQAMQTYQLPNLTFKVLDFHNYLQLNEKKFDYIIGNGILHHLFYTLDDSLEAMRNHLKEHGKIIFIEPNIYNPYCYVIFRTSPFFRRMANLEPDEMAFSKNWIHRKLIKHSFSDIKVEYLDFLLPNTPSFLITPVIVLGSFLEKIPLISYLSQSIFITAKK